jgi:wyosine [tRNA(Phe)-imidazoG37] synthetase (radical SAM superfamily)
MSTFLFDKLVFGPVYSRRLGISLGINLLPNDSKYCNFNCIYCECGWTKNNDGKKLVLPDRKDLQKMLAEKLKELRGTINEPDTITFAGNGEPTIHPEFDKIIDDTIELRDQLAPKTRISVLSNASLLHKPKIFEALLKVDQNIQKLDTGIEETFQNLNQPISNLKLNEVAQNLQAFQGRVILQTLFLRGVYNGIVIDNTTEKELNAWLLLVTKINPEYVMIYPIDRGTPAEGLEKIPEDELHEIAKLVNQSGIKTEVYY